MKNVLRMSAVLIPCTSVASTVFKSRKISDLILLQRFVDRNAFIIFFYFLSLSVGVVLPFTVFSQIRLDIERVHTGIVRKAELN